MRCYPRFAVPLLSAAAFLSWRASSGTRFSPILWWPATSLGLVGLAYLGLGSRVFGKQPDGRLRLSHRIALGPWLVFSLLIWRIRLLCRRRPPYHRITSTLYAGARVRPNDLPPDTQRIADLTCEFACIAANLPKPPLLMPLLDGTAPKTVELLNFISELARETSIVYLHCAEGRGRTGLVLAALLAWQDRTLTAEAAVRLAQSRRPEIRLSRHQKRALDDLVMALGCGEAETRALA